MAKKREPERGPTIIIRPGQGAPGSISQVQRQTRCRFCGREVVMYQCKDRSGGKLPIMWRCRKHGTLDLHQIQFGYGG